MNGVIRNTQKIIRTCRDLLEWYSRDENNEHWPIYMFWFRELCSAEKSLCRAPANQPDLIDAIVRLLRRCSALILDLGWPFTAAEVLEEAEILAQARKEEVFA